MKTFKELCIGDTFYGVSVNHQSKEKPTFKKITVTNIALIDGSIKINHHGSTYHNYYEFVDVVENCDTDLITHEKDIYYTTDYEQVVELLAKAGLNHIQKVEQEIESKKKEIERIRIAYWEYLNHVVKEPIKH